MTDFSAFQLIAKVLMRCDLKIWSRFIRHHQTSSLPLSSSGVARQDASSYQGLQPIIDNNYAEQAVGTEAPSNGGLVSATDVLRQIRVSCENTTLHYSTK